MAHARARVPKVAIRRICIAALPESATCLHKKDTSEEDAEYLANSSYRHFVRSISKLANAGYTQHHRRPQVP